MLRITSLFYALRDFVYPPVCRTCDTLLENGADQICLSCWGSFRPVVPADDVWNETVRTLREDAVADDFISCYLFEKEGKLQEAVHLLKYSGVRSIGRRLGRDLGTALSDNPHFGGADFLVPVPLHRTKKRERGYNQSELICEGMAECLRIPVVPDLLVRTRHTRSQTQLTRGERKENVYGAFACNPRCRMTAEGAAVILVDDVITTAATVTACAAVLRAGGASCIIAASVALAR